MPLSNFTLPPLHVYGFQTTLIGIRRIAAEAQTYLFFGSLAAPMEDHSPWCVADRYRCSPLHQFGKQCYVFKLHGKGFASLMF